MPTDVNNLKEGQRVRAEFTVRASTVTSKRYADLQGDSGELLTLLRTDIITDWPPEPNADEAGWETESTFRCADPDLHSFFVEPEMGFQYRVQRRPLAPKWVPTVGDTVVTSDLGHGEIAFIGDNRAVVNRRDGTQQWVLLSNLTQPKEQPHED